jgi:uncharacterized protein YjiS (DUF1127 family)
MAMSNSTRLPLHGTHQTFFSTLLGRALAGLGDRFRRFAAINELEQLSDRQLRDIGLERRQIAEITEREIARLRTR